MPNSHSKETLKELLTRIVWHNVCHMAIRVLGSISLIVMCKCTIITLLDDLKLRLFSNVLTKVKYLLFGRRSLSYTGL